MDNAESLIENIITKAEDIDVYFTKKASNIGLDFAFFEHETIYKIYRNNYELTFIYIIAYLYKLYIERGKTNIKYIIKKYNLFRIEKDESVQHLKIVNDFRTYLFHFLNLSEKHNESIKKKFNALVSCGNRKI